MKDSIKPAFVRWLTDLMKADKIIAIGEIEYMEKLCKEYFISQLDIEKSLSLSLAEACIILVEQARKKERIEIVKKLKDLSFSDGACAREEALMIMALSYCLEDETRHKSKMVSFKTPHIDFVDSQILFIEPNYDDDINANIKSHFKSIINEMRMGGFDFIYIPSIASHYQNSNKELLGKVIKYLAPTLSDGETHNVLDVICNMTTTYFRNEILKEKLGITITVKKPSFLIKIGNSYVNGEMMSDFLLIEIERNIFSQIEKMITTFLEYQRGSTVIIKNYTDSRGDFVYTGFYKTIFDLITYRKGMRSTLVINPDKRKGRLQIMDEVISDLEMGLAETALYVFLICESISSRKGVFFKNQGAKTLVKIQERYTQIYSLFFGARDNVPNITIAATRNRMLTVIRNAIKENKVLTDKWLYMPNTNTARIFVAIEPHLIYVQEGKKNIPLIESSFWTID